MTLRQRAAALAAIVLLAGCGGTIKEQAGGVADYERGKRAYDQENWSDAVLDLKAFVEAYPGTERTDDALYYLGDGYFRMKDYALASGHLDRLLRDFPGSIHEPDARFLLARCDDLQSHAALLDQTETDRALGRYREFLELYPDHARAGEARARVQALRDRLAEKRFRNGRLYLRLREFDSAELYLRSVVTEYPDSRWAAEASLVLAEALLKRGKRNEALEALRAAPLPVAGEETKRKIEERRRELEGGSAAR
ncbi:MAG TPA: outer membrane protein assembly factor BamD [Acidobacteriota bacterium]|nr:outer membrane protein assembly factor BamD [Acidobacteriota bacterium]